MSLDGMKDVLSGTDINNTTPNEIRIVSRLYPPQPQPQNPSLTHHIWTCFSHALEQRTHGRQGMQTCVTAGTCPGHILRFNTAPTPQQLWQQLCIGAQWMPDKGGLSRPVCWATTARCWAITRARPTFLSDFCMLEGRSHLQPYLTASLKKPGRAWQVLASWRRCLICNKHAWEHQQLSSQQEKPGETWQVLASWRPGFNCNHS
ncbi:hypothetical protein DUNSADRAFT_10713 [Dunaliella salina]|uniref:Encoded protein n=1 Tax=Dunaliella salina TaxID=3046 RepID=A0ABQ7GET2_DUNSA|nr:hypothetical protein DUNSADRAFT_10713 [Dunaliella salina]|eukprot:KAF5833094.1 hypothetical protein DUNSADRAFT_10713 [Dunaliella salina]